jgi:hypothetical protein
MNQDIPECTLDWWGLVEKGRNQYFWTAQKNRPLHQEQAISILKSTEA